MISALKSRLAPAHRAGFTCSNALIAFTVFGILTRLVQYAWRYSYWHDEAFLVLNITHKTARQLLGPLEFPPLPPQAAPPLFLLAQRGIYLVLGGSEWSMRLLPTILGIAALILFALLARRILSPIGATIAVGLFALSDALHAHAAEAKQYSGDVFVAVLLLFLAIPRRGENEETSPWRIIGVSALAGILVWFSHPTLFVFTAISFAWLMQLRPLSIKRRRAFAYLAGNLLFGISALALYFLSIRVQQTTFLFDYWAERFVDFHRPLAVPWWLVRQMLKLCDYPYEPLGFLILALVILGIIGWWKDRRWSGLTLLIGPILLVLLAAAAHRYPFGGHRLTIFLAPGLFLLAGGGVEYLLARLPARRQWIAPILPALLIAYGIAMTGYHLAVPRGRQNIRPAVEFLRAHRQPDEMVYAMNCMEFYCYWPLEDPRAQLIVDRLNELPPARSWLIYSFAPSNWKKVQPKLAQDKAMGTVLLEQIRPDSAVILLERSQ
jgi:4-amino-4-deoxy-L-arabinose transferase-like glycosyltransferase